MTFPIKPPEVFAFEVASREFLLAFDTARMTGDANRISVEIGRTKLAVIQSHAGVKCKAECPIAWKSVYWPGTPLTFSTDARVFARLLRRDVLWNTIEIRGRYPDAALNQEGTEHSTMWRFTTREVEFEWPFRLESRDDNAAIISEQSPFNAGALAQALRLVKDASTPEAAKKNRAYAVASVGGGRGIVAGTAARLIYDPTLDTPSMYFDIAKLPDLAHVVGHLGKHASFEIVGDQVFFYNEAALCTTQLGPHGPPDFSSLEEGPSPIAEVEFATLDFTRDLDKLLTQVGRRDELVRWRTTGRREDGLNLSVSVAGGEAHVRIQLPGSSELPQDVDLLLRASDLDTLVSLRRHPRLTLSFYPDMIRSRQAGEGCRIDTYVQGQRQRSSRASP